MLKMPSAISNPPSCISPATAQRACLTVKPSSSSAPMRWAALRRKFLRPNWLRSCAHPMLLPLPPVIILNACSTAIAPETEVDPSFADELTGVEIGRPFAAELIESGIGAVVGMAGPVADLACRLFTREFYIALVQGGEIGAAAARGRRAAIAYGGYAPAATLHWAMPTLYLSEQSGPAKATLQPNLAETTRYRQAKEFNGQPAYPAFCDRWEDYQIVFPPDGREDPVRPGGRLQTGQHRPHPGGAVRTDTPAAGVGRSSAARRPRSDLDVAALAAQTHRRQ